MLKRPLVGFINANVHKLFVITYCYKKGIISQKKFQN